MLLTQMILPEIISTNSFVFSSNLSWIHWPNVKMWVGTELISMNPSFILLIGAKFERFFNNLIAFVITFSRLSINILKLCEIELIFYSTTVKDPRKLHKISQILLRKFGKLLKALIWPLITILKYFLYPFPDNYYKHLNNRATFRRESIAGDCEQKNI